MIQVLLRTNYQESALTGVCILQFRQMTESVNDDAFVCVVCWKYAIFVFSQNYQYVLRACNVPDILGDASYMVGTGNDNRSANSIVLRIVTIFCKLPYSKREAASECFYPNRCLPLSPVLKRFFHESIVQFDRNKCDSNTPLKTFFQCYSRYRTTDTPYLLFT
jgi:hypothetical protein